MDIKRFEILPILNSIRINEKIGIQITCIEVNANDVYLGTVDSFVVCYKNVIEQKTLVMPNPQYRYLTSKKPVTQMKIASILDRLLVVYDSTFVALNLGGLEVNNNLRIKNVYAFCLNENPISLEDPFSVELCLVKKRTVSICHLQADKMTLLREITVPEQPILVAMDGYSVCFAGESNYYVLDCKSATSQQLCSIETSSLMSPVCKHVARNEFLINGLSHLGIFVNASGISEKPPIDWGVDVKRIAYSYPYILCLKEHSIAIISVIDSQMKEDFPFEKGVYIDNFDGKILIASSDSVFFLRRIPWEEQIDSLLNNGKTQEAIDLCASLYETGHISNRDFDYAKLVRVKAGLTELFRDNFGMAQQYLLESEFDIEIFLNCYEKISTYLQLDTEEGDFSGTILGEVKSKMILNENAFLPFLISYIKELIAQSKFLYTSNALKINTCLLILYLSDIPKYYNCAEQLIRSDLKYDLKATEKYLQDHSLHHLLANLYSCRPEHHEGALGLWKKLELGQLTDAQYNGLTNIAQLLRTCQNSKLILNTIDFVLERNQSLGAEILIANTRQDETEQRSAFLDPEYVVGILHKYRRAFITYLEYLVFSLKVTSTSIHNSLALIYIEIISLQQETEEEDSTLCEQILQKLNNLLETSGHYDAETVLKSLLKNGLDYETAFLYGKMGEHMKAFEIFIGKHMDHERALRHCVHYATQEKSSHIYGTLLDVYLDLYKKNGPEITKPLLNLVNHSKSQFDLADTLKQLPADWPLHSVSSFVRNNLRTAFNCHQQSSMCKALTLSLLERVKEEKRLASRGPIRLCEDSICAICKNKIFDSKFVWLPSVQCYLHNFCYTSPGSRAKGT